jgi:hypothetical protein
MIMANGPNLGQKRRPRKRSKKRRSTGNQKVLILSLVAVAVVVVVIFLIAAGLDPTIGAVICMLTLAVIFYLMTMGQSKPRPRKRRTKGKTEVQTEPQFYTALPSTLGLTEIPEEQPKPQVKLPPRPIRAARRRRDFIAYPVAVGGGDYSDSYVQVDKDTVLRLRSEMTPESKPKYLPGLRIDSLPSSKIAAVMSQAIIPSVVPVDDPSAEAVPVVAEAVPVVAEAVPVVAEAVPVVADSTGTPVVQSAVVQEEEEEEQMEFDMEWD